MIKKDFHDIVEVINNLGCACLLWGDDNYIHPTKHYEIRV